MVTRVHGPLSRRTADQLATEEPLEIRITAAGEQRVLAVTMRTPGADFELIAGYLLAEGVISSRRELHSMSYCRGAGAARLGNTVKVRLDHRHLNDLAGLERSTYTSSACGVCGRVSLDGLELRGLRPLPVSWRLAAGELLGLPARLRGAQGLFDRTGGLHAAALFDRRGDLLALREDVGRHNALDKLLGWALLEGRLPLSNTVLLLSGRASFELVQKSLVAGVPLVCALSAPSSLAVDVARRFGMTLVGFLREGRFNIYAGQERILLEGEVSA